jgi:hypothetical protein
LGEDRSRAQKRAGPSQEACVLMDVNLRYRLHLVHLVHLVFTSRRHTSKRPKTHHRHHVRVPSGYHGLIALLLLLLDLLRLEFARRLSRLDLLYPLIKIVLLGFRRRGRLCSEFGNLVANVVQSRFDDLGRLAEPPEICASNETRSVDPRSPDTAIKDGDARDRPLM